MGRCTIWHLVLKRTSAPMRRPLPWVAGLVYVCAASAGGVYEEVPIDKDEWRLIEESKDLEGYFSSQPCLRTRSTTSPATTASSSTARRVRRRSRAWCSAAWGRGAV